jgi:crotonobetainyl-CoA:carnitine CoA-transferase CaiB-like acyl-CoA transferase
MDAPLRGLNVLECTLGPAGARAGGILADYGANVVTVKHPDKEDRNLSDAAHSVFDRGKRQVLLDLRTEQDLATMERVLGVTDVLLQSWRPGKAEDLGLGWEQLHARHPALVCCSLSGFGPDHPLADMRGYEALVHAHVGTMAEQAGHRDPPIFQAIPFAGIGASYLAVIGILAALYRRQSDGTGRHVETSLLDGALAYHSVMWGESDASVTAGIPPGRQRLVDGQRFISRSFLCSDGEYIGVHTGAVGAFGRLMDDRVPPSDSGLDMGVPLEPDQVQIVAEEVPKIFASRPRAEWVDLLLAADVCGIEHLRACECFDHAQVVHNHMVWTVDDPHLGTVEQVSAAAKFLGLEHSTPRPAPAVRQHDEGALGIFEGVGEVAIPFSSPDRRPLLAGVKVLDFGAYYAGPYSSRLLADLGADVVKLEPTHGDQLRGLERCFYSAQAGKRSIAADVKDPDLGEAVVGLLKWADIVHHNLRPGAAERLGMDASRYRAVRPDGIYLHAPGWGSSGPHMLRQSFAPMLSGLAGVTFEVAGQFNPPLPPVGHEDPGNGLLGAVGMLLALVNRRSCGFQHIENPQLNATLAHMAHVVRTTGGKTIGASLLDPAQMGMSALESLYPTDDGWVCVVAMHDDEIHGLGRVLGLEILDDDRFSTRDARACNDDALRSEISVAMASRRSAELISALREAGVAALEPVGPNIHRYMNDPFAQRTGRVAQCRHPAKGMVREVGHLIRFTDAEVAPHRLAPELGEHSEEILSMVGCSRESIESLRARGVVRSA